MLDQLGFIEKSLQGQGLTATPRVREGRNNRTEPTRDDTPRRSLFDFVLRHHATVHGPSVHPGVVLISEIIWLSTRRDICVNCVAGWRVGRRSLPNTFFMIFATLHVPSSCMD